MTNPTKSNPSSGLEFRGSISARFEEIAKRHANQWQIKSARSMLQLPDLKKYSRNWRILSPKLGQSRPCGFAAGGWGAGHRQPAGGGKVRSFLLRPLPTDPPSRLNGFSRILVRELLVTDFQSFPWQSRLLHWTAKFSCFPNSRKIPIRHAFYIQSKEVLGIFYTSGSTGEPKGVLRTHYLFSTGWRWIIGITTLVPETGCYICSSSMFVLP